MPVWSYVYWKWKHTRFKPIVWLRHFYPYLVLMVTLPLIGVILIEIVNGIPEKDSKRTYFEEYTLEDGTRCVVLLNQSQQRTGVSCDFQKIE